MWIFVNVINAIGVKSGRAPDNTGLPTFYWLEGDFIGFLRSLTTEALLTVQ